MAQEPNKATPAASTPLSLSEAILAPLDSIFKAQVHSARSFINFLFQMAYPHLPLKDDGSVNWALVTEDMKKPYTLDISYLKQDGQSTGTIKIPSLALLPIAPVGVDEAEIKFALSVEEVGSHHVIQDSEEGTVDKEQNDWGRKKRPWFLIDDPKSIRGTFTPRSQNSDDSENSTKNTNAIEISIKVKRVPTPAALEKALSVLTQTIQT
jgi:hypothetical protein